MTNCCRKCCKIFCKNRDKIENCKECYSYVLQQMVKLDKEGKS